MGKKRSSNTAKTGDKALYKNRSKLSSISIKTDDDDDAVYSKVDRFYNQRDEEDFIELNQGHDDDSDSDQDGGLVQQQSVLNLGGGIMSSSEEEDANEEDEDEELVIQKKDLPPTQDASSSSDDDSESEDDENIRDWGKKKSVYYHGDTADLEIGQEQEDAFVEEEAAREVQVARMKDMSEEDFVLSDDEGNDISEKKDTQTAKRDKHETSSSSKQHRDPSQWSKREQRIFLEQHHAEFLPLVNHFKPVVQDFDQCTNVVVKAIYEGKEAGKETIKNIGATKEGERYLLSRALVQSSTALNLAMYMLLKSEYASQQQTDLTSTRGTSLDNDNVMTSHPVLDHLQKLNSLAETMENAVSSNDNALQQQMNSLVKAHALLVQEGERGPNPRDEEGNDQHSHDSDDSERDIEIEMKQTPEDSMGAPTKSVVEDEVSSSSNDNDSQEKDDEVKAKNQTALMNEARFALRSNEFEFVHSNKTRKRQRRAVPDFGEEHNATDEATTQASRSLANTVNALEQRFAHSKKVAKKHTNMADHLDDLPDQDDDAVRRGLELMEAELGRASDEEDVQGGEEDHDEDGYYSSNDKEDDFYAQVKKASQQKKKKRKELYAVAPKFPRVEADMEGERAVSRTIMKNRGLVPHKNKLNRNPRVKKREQYRKAIIRRKGAVRAMRDPQEGQAYGGEETGIKSGIRRSRNLT